MFSPQREQTTNEVLNANSLSKKTYSLSPPNLFGVYLEKSRVRVRLHLQISLIYLADTTCIFEPSWRNLVTGWKLRTKQVIKNHYSMFRLFANRFKIKFQTCLLACAFDDRTIKNLDTLLAMKIIHCSW